MNRDLKPFIQAGRILYLLAQTCQNEGRTQEAKDLYRRAFRQALLVAELRNPNYRQEFGIPDYEPDTRPPGTLVLVSSKRCANQV